MPEAAKINPENVYKHWTSEIQDALAREKTYRKMAQRCVDLYEAKNADDTPFAILYSNVETLDPGCLQLPAGPHGPAALQRC